MKSPDLSKLKEGDRSEWDVACDWLWPHSHRIAKFNPTIRRCEECKDEADIVAKDALIKLWKKKGGDFIQKAETLEELVALLFKVIRDQAIDHCRKRYAQRRGGG